MKRFNLLAVLMGLLFFAAFGSKAFADYCPRLGRFLQADPGPPVASARIGSAGMPAASWQFIERDPYADGPNLYQFVQGNPINRVDPTGLWSGKEHTSLTREALNQAFPYKLSGDLLKCKNYVQDRLTQANLGQDQVDAFKENRRHYNRDLTETAANGDAVYTLYLKNEEAAFKHALSKTPAACDDALAALGRMSHAWQDYFAHAVLASTGAAGPAWSASPPITGTPDALNPQLMPSSWGGLTSWGEHGRTEPADRDARQRRYDDARDFVAAKYDSYLKQWFAKCMKCCPPPKK